MSETQDKDGNLIYAQTLYDHLARTDKTSRPYKANATPVWTSFGYDLIGRTISTTSTDSNGASTTSRIAYNGFTITATNAKNQTKTEIRNSQNQLKTVTDAYGKTLRYNYDVYGNLIQTTDALNNITSISYDKRGRKIGMNDPDQGAWTYRYDALGQLKRQTNAKNQVVTFAYDKLGRMTKRTEPDLISSWSYDVCDATYNAAGKCIGKPVKETTDNGYVRVTLYDNLGRPTSEVDNLDIGYGVTKSYDTYGRVEKLVYPAAPNTTALQITHVYSSTGYLTQIKNSLTSAIYWQANSTDAEGRVTNETYGNNLINTKTYDANTGLLKQTQSGTIAAPNSVNNQSYVYDTLGNLTQRYDGVTGLNESFGYDNLNRLTGTTAQSGTLITSVSVTYDEIGNITTKSNVGSYSYGKIDPTTGNLIQPHAVTKIMMNDGVTQYAAYSYDANGNMLSGAGRTITWNSWNMPSNITGTTPNKSTPTGIASSNFSFIYNATHERVKETLPDGTILYNISPRVDTGIHVEKRIKPDGTVLFVNSLYAGNFPLGTVTTSTKSGVTSTKTRYFHVDHLGSIVAITDELGNVTERRSYDAWGKRRNSNGTAMSNAFVTPEERHGFTGHEELDDVGLIHMNGRLYDPATARFLSADPTIQYADDMQNYNRYSYINNNPLSTIDASGYGFFKSVFKSIGKAFSGVAHAVKSVLKNPVIRTVAAVAAAYYTGGLFGDLYIMSTTTPSLVLAGAIQGATAGFAGGFVASGGNVKAALTAALAGGVTGATAGYLDYGSNYPLSRVGFNGISNGVSSKIQGGDFMDGLRSGLVTSAFTYGNVQMRQAMIANSLGNVMNDGTGLSNGMFGDFFKLAGERLNELDIRLGKIFGGPLGGTQSGQGRLGFYQYEKGGFVDMVLESFAGPHDFANSPHFYAPDGTGLPPILGLKGKLLELSTNMTSSLAFATPFAAAAVAEQSNYSAYRYIK